MKMRIVLASAITCVIMAASCTPQPATDTGSSTNAPVASKTPGPLPDRGYRAQITLPDAPLKLRVGQKETITLKIKNTSDVIWWAVGGEKSDRSDNKFYIAVGNHWLDKDGKRTSDLEGHNGLKKDLRPGEETEMTLEITAPKEAGEYTLELDMVQEGVSWFGDKGSPTTKAKVTVVR